jgi:hypothetical protein
MSHSSDSENQLDWWELFVSIRVSYQDNSYL